MHASDAVLARLIDQVDNARAQRAPLDIRGGSTKRFYGEAPAGTPLDVTDLSGISSYEPTELVVTADLPTVADLVRNVVDAVGRAGAVLLAKRS